MTISGKFITTIAASGLAICALGTGAPAAVADPATNTSTCTVQQRSDLKATVTDLRTRIAAQKLTAQERADMQAARKAAIADLRAKAQAAAGAAKLTPAQKAALRAQIQVLIDADRGEIEARHAAITGLKAQLLTAVTALKACHA